MTTPNIPLIEQVASQLITFPETHDQSRFWHCGTPSCAAGWAMHFAGLTEERTHGLDGYELASQYSGRDVEELRRKYACTDMIIGQGVLGITELDAERLFWDYNSNAMVVAMLKDLANGEHLRPCDEYAHETGWYEDMDARKRAAALVGDVANRDRFPRPTVDIREEHDF